MGLRVSIVSCSLVYGPFLAVEFGVRRLRIPPNGCSLRRDEVNAFKGLEGGAPWYC